MSQQNNSSKSQVWFSWPGGIGWPTPIPLKGGSNMAGNVLPAGFKNNAQGVVEPPVTVFNGGKRKSRRAQSCTRKNRKASRKNRKQRRNWTSRK